MSADSSTTTGAQVQERLRVAREEIAAIRARISRGSLVSLLVGLLLLGLLSVYFYIGYTKFKDLTEPKLLVGIGQNLLDENLPRAREALQKQVEASADEWAQGLSEQAVANIPQARVSIQKAVLEQVEGGLKQQSVLTEKRFREFLELHRDIIRRDLKDLSTSPELAQERIEELEMLFEEQFQSDFRGQFREMFEALLLTNDRMKQLAADENLAPSDRLEREVLMIARRLQEEKVGRTPRLVPEEDNATRVNRMPGVASPDGGEPGEVAPGVAPAQPAAEEASAKDQPKAAEPGSELPAGVFAGDAEKKE